MVEFDLILLSPFLEPITNNTLIVNFLNWKLISKKNINIKILEVDFV